VKPGYRFIDHTADFRLEIFGVDEKDLFVQAAMALTDLITDPKTLHNRRRQTIKVSGDDWSDLMVGWLRELLYLWSGEEQLVSRVSLQSLEPTHLKAVVTTDAFDADRHPIRNEIKAVTYHQIEVRPWQDGWRARVVFDI
jgi:SHS2 domain-containing protein